MNPQDILNNLSTHLKSAVARSIQYASSMKHYEVTPLHLLLALHDEPGCLGAEVMEKLHIHKEFVEKKLLVLPVQDVVPTATLPELSRNSRSCLEKAMLLAYEYGHKYVGTEHLLFGIIEVNDKAVQALLKELEVSKKDIEEQITTVLTSTSKFPEMKDVNAAMEEIQDIVENQETEAPMASPKNAKRPITALDVFTTNLTDKEAQKDIDPVVGRELEIERLIDILCRRTKNNPVLVGEPGVGKTAIVEGLAKRIVEGRVPDILKNKKILSLDLTLLISGTIYRGEFEARLKQTIDELSKKDNVIIFIDELHNIIGAGSNQGTMDAANILKPALARGQLRCIGATTIDEYKKYISSDPALERRFQSIQVEEPTREQTVKILEGVKKNYETYHQVSIPEDTVKAAVDFSVKYIHDNFLPDKAIDLIDEAAASVRVRQKSSPLEAELISISLQRQELEKEKQEAIVNEQFTEANKLKEKIETLEKRSKELESKKQKMKNKKIPVVTKEDVARVVNRKLHIDEKVILSSEWESLQELERALNTSIVGQSSVIEQLVATLKRSYLSGADRKKPLASFIFAGPSGVGKTALAKTLAEKLYHSEQALIKIDMSEFAEQHGISKLLGSPAGYIGYKERNQFTDKMKRRPFSVILFDEVDKAHPDVIRLLLQILDEGELTDSSGKKISFKNAIIILTTNLGSEFYKSVGIGFDMNEANGEKTHQKNLQKAVVNRLKDSLEPALLARVGLVLTFNPLDLKTIEQIVRNRIEFLSNNFHKTHAFSLESDEGTIGRLAEAAYNPDEGARLIEKVVDDTIHSLVIEVLEGQKRKKKFLLKHKEGKIVIV